MYVSIFRRRTTSHDLVLKLLLSLPDDSCRESLILLRSSVRVRVHQDRLYLSHTIGIKLEDYHVAYGTLLVLIMQRGKHTYPV